MMHQSARQMLRLILLGKPLCDNPWFRSGATVAMLAISTASSIWSLMVLSIRDSLADTSYLKMPLLVSNEDLLAAVLAALSLLQLVWLRYHLRPWRHRLWSVGYVAQAGFWFAALVLVSMDSAPVRPGAVAWLVTGVILGTFAFTSLPRDRNGDGDIDGP